MPFLTVRVDGTQLASVNTSGHTILAVQVRGTRVDVNYADLSMLGDIFNDVGGHRVWIDGMMLSLGQVVEAELSAGGVSNDAGQIIQELHPDQFEPPELGSAEQIAHLRSTTQVREGFTLELVSSAGTLGQFRTQPKEHGFAFRVVWSDRLPQRALATLHAYTIDGVGHGKPRRHLASERMQVGNTVRLVLVA